MKGAFSFFTGLLFLLCSIAAAEVPAPFRWNQKSVDGGTLITLNVAAGHYLDSASVKFFLKDSAGKDLKISVLTPPLKKNGADGTVQQIYPAGVWRFFVPAYPVHGSVEFQGCSEEGMCMMPDEFRFDSGNTVISPVSDPVNQYHLLRKAEGFMRKSDFMDFLRGSSTGGFFGNAGLIGIMLLTLLGGIGLNFTPCILPMVPVTLIVIGAKGGGRPGLLRGAAYGGGMAAAYGILGILAALFGMTFGTINSKPWFNFATGAIFLFLALCMAGIFNFNFGSSRRIDLRKLQGNTLLAPFAMGAVAALLAGACVAPVVISVLVLTGREYSSGNGWSLLLPFLLGIGMALPWPFAGWGLSVLPRPGKFMLAIKYLLTAAVAGLGIYYLLIGWSLAQKRDLPAPGVNQPSDGFAALAAAGVKSRQENKAILIKFGASWCKNCHAMEREVLSDPEVSAFISKNFIPVDFPAENPEEPAIKALLKKWNIPGFPAFAIVETVPGNTGEQQ